MQSLKSRITTSDNCFNDKQNMFYRECLGEEKKFWEYLT